MRITPQQSPSDRYARIDPRSPTNALQHGSHVFSRKCRHAGRARVYVRSSISRDKLHGCAYGLDLQPAVAKFDVYLDPWPQACCDSQRFRNYQSPCCINGGSHGKILPSARVGVVGKRPKRALPEITLCPGRGCWETTQNALCRKSPCARVGVVGKRPKTRSEGNHLVPGRGRWETTQTRSAGNELVPGRGRWETTQTRAETARPFATTIPSGLRRERNHSDGLTTRPTSPCRRL
jgi:hypothetical protein